MTNLNRIKSCDLDGMVTFLNRINNDDIPWCNYSSDEGCGELEDCKACLHDWLLRESISVPRCPRCCGNSYFTDNTMRRIECGNCGITSRLRKMDEDIGPFIEAAWDVED